MHILTRIILALTLLFSSNALYSTELTELEIKDTVELTTYYERMGQRYSFSNACLIHAKNELNTASQDMFRMLKATNDIEEISKTTYINPILLDIYKRVVVEKENTYQSIFLSNRSTMVDSCKAYFHRLNK